MQRKLCSSRSRNLQSWKLRTSWLAAQRGSDAEVKGGAGDPDPASSPVPISLSSQLVADIWRPSYLLKPNLRSEGSCVGGAVHLSTPPPPRPKPHPHRPPCQQRAACPNTRSCTPPSGGEIVKSLTGSVGEATPPSVPPSLATRIYTPARRPDKVGDSKGGCRLGVQTGT